MVETETAARILNSGGIVIFPTETVYGIGCLITDTEAIDKLYQIKQRDPGKPVLVLVKDEQEAEGLVVFNEAARRLANAFWPGPLTICLPASKSVPRSILGPAATLGVRVSSNSFIKEIMPSLNAPLLAPSANVQGESPPSSSTEIDKNLVSKVNYVVNLEPEGKKPSTVISFSGQDWKIVREGDIKRAQIAKVINSKE